MDLIGVCMCMCMCVYAYAYGFNVFNGRVAASVEHLLAIEFEASSTAAYGVAHILAALTVTNAELRRHALADKGITPEQFDQLQRE